MGSEPNIPSGGTPPAPPFWHDEEDWIVLIEFLRDDDPQDRARATQSIGYMLAYAQTTNSRMLAMIGSAKDSVYELLFSFDSPKHKAEFLRLLQSNDATRYEESEVLIPRQDEIDQAQPLSRVLPEDVMRQVTVIAATVFGGGSTIQ